MKTTVKHRPWSPDEDRILRRHYGPHAPSPRPAQTLAALLGRSLDQVRDKARRMGLTAKRAGYRRFSTYHKHLVNMHQLRLSSRHIAESLGLHEATVNKWFVRLGLKSHGTTPETKRLMSRIRAAKLGWPEVERVALARILNVIHAAEWPLDRWEVAQALGKSCETVRNNLRHLVRQGALLTVPGRRRHGDRGTLPTAYVLAPELAEARRKREGKGALATVAGIDMGGETCADD